MSVDADDANVGIEVASVSRARVDLIVRLGNQIYSIAGDPVSGASLRNQLGAVRPRSGWHVIGRVLVRPGATAITDGDIVSEWDADTERKIAELEQGLRRA